MQKNLLYSKYASNLHFSLLLTVQSQIFNHYCSDFITNETKKLSVLHNISVYLAFISCRSTTVTFPYIQYVLCIYTHTHRDCLDHLINKSGEQRSVRLITILNYLRDSLRFCGIEP